MMRSLCYLSLAFAVFPSYLSALPDRERDAHPLSPVAARACYAEAAGLMGRLREEWVGCRLMVNGRELFLRREGTGMSFVWDGGELPIPEDAMDLDPLKEDLTLASFDLLCPFFFWPEPTYDGPARMMGRRAQRFSVKNSAAPNSPIASVKIWIDASYHYPLAWDAIGRDGRPLRRFQLRSLKKLGDGHWTVQSVEFSLPQERKSTRVEIFTQEF